MSQRPLPNNQQHAQQTYIHASSGIRTRNPSKRAAADLRLRLRDHWDLSFSFELIIIIKRDYFVTHTYKLLKSEGRSPSEVGTGNTCTNHVTLMLQWAVIWLRGLFAGL